VKKEIQGIFHDLKKNEIPNLDASISYLKGWYDWPRLPLEIPQNSALVKSTVKAYERVVGSKPVVTGEKYWTDASIFTYANIPSIVFGPGNDECYWVDEYIETDQLFNAAKIYATLMLDFGSRSRSEIRSGLLS
jgi:acetylornithine deacetylase/succinyl-diaminopimelate desuccinylase-like protein